MNLSFSAAGEVQSQQNTVRRDTELLDKRVNVNIPLAKDFSGTNIFTANVSETLDVALTCGTCMTTGSLEIDLEVSTDFLKFPPVDGTITVPANGLSATVGLDLVVSAALTAEFDRVSLSSTSHFSTILLVSQALPLSAHHSWSIWTPRLQASLQKSTSP